jgi:hypothetical protein
LTGNIVGTWIVGFRDGDEFGSLPADGKVSQSQEMVEKVSEGFAGEVA